MNRTPNYRMTVPVYSGSVMDSTGELAQLKRNISNLNFMNQQAKWQADRRYVVRLRYRGPRRPGPLGQSMCLKQDATSADVYLYQERRY